MGILEKIKDIELEMSRTQKVSTVTVPSKLLCSNASNRIKPLKAISGFSSPSLRNYARSC